MQLQVSGCPPRGAGGLQRHGLRPRSQRGALRHQVDEHAGDESKTCQRCSGDLLGCLEVHKSPLILPNGGEGV